MNEMVVNVNSRQHNSLAYLPRYEIIDKTMILYLVPYRLMSKDADTKYSYNTLILFTPSNTNISSTRGFSLNSTGECHHALPCDTNCNKLNTSFSAPQHLASTWPVPRHPPHFANRLVTVVIPHVYPSTFPSLTREERSREVTLWTSQSKSMSQIRIFLTNDVEFLALPQLVYFLHLSSCASCG